MPSRSHSQFEHYFYSNLYGWANRGPRGPRGVKKSDYFLQIKLWSFCAKIALKRHKLQKVVKTKKNVNVWGQSYRTKHQMECLVDSGTSLNTPGTPGRRY